MRIEGNVVCDRYAAGSKSDHQAVLLQTPDQRYLLRRLGGNPFYDKDLVNLVGKSIVAEGDIHGQTLVMSSWHESPT
jgi:hypothetical protein